MRAIHRKKFEVILCPMIAYRGSIFFLFFFNVFAIDFSRLKMNVFFNS